MQDDDGQPRGVHCDDDGEGEANRVDDEMSEAPVSVQRRKINHHVIAPLAQVLLKLQINVVH